MTNEDKKLIGEYMGCQYDDDAGLYFYDNEDEGEVDIFKFDLNDASLCVQEMQKRGDLVDFANFAKTRGGVIILLSATTFESDKVFLSTDFFNPENFFGVMAKWLKEGKQ